VIDTATNVITTTINLGGGDLPIGLGINPAGTRIYSANEATNTVSVIDTGTNTVVATIPSGTTPCCTGPQQVTISPDGTRGYVTNYGDGTVTVFDTSNNTVLATVGVGTQPNRAGMCSNGNALLASGATFTARTSSALDCTLGSGGSATGPVFT